VEFEEKAAPLFYTIRNFRTRFQQPILQGSRRSRFGVHSEIFKKQHPRHGALVEEKHVTIIGASVLERPRQTERKQNIAFGNKESEVRR